MLMYLLTPPFHSCLISTLSSIYFLCIRLFSPQFIFPILVLHLIFTPLKHSLSILSPVVWPQCSPRDSHKFSTSPSYSPAYAWWLNKKVWLYKQADFDKIDSHLSSSNWSSFLPSNPNDALSFFYDKFFKIVHQFTHQTVIFASPPHLASPPSPLQNKNPKASLFFGQSLKLS